MLCVKPTRSFGPAVVAWITGREKDTFQDMWVRWVGPLAGAAVAAGVHGCLGLEGHRPSRPFRVKPNFGQPATVFLFEGRPVTRGCRFKFRAVREERELVSTGNADGDAARYARHFRAPSPIGMTVKSMERSPWKACYPRSGKEPVERKVGNRRGKRWGCLSFPWFTSHVTFLHACTLSPRGTLSSPQHEVMKRVHQSFQLRR